MEPRHQGGAPLHPLSGLCEPILQRLELRLELLGNVAAEGAEVLVRKLGLEAIPIWRETVPGITFNGSIVVAAPRDQTEISAFMPCSRSTSTMLSDGATSASQRL